MKAELKNLAKESFLEELERLRMASPSHFSNENYYNPNDLDRQSYLENELQRLQSMVGDARKQTHPGNGPMMSQPANNHLMNVEWSSPIVRDQMTPAFPPLLSSQAPQHHFGGGFATPHHQNHFFGENSNELDPPFHNNNNEEIGLPVLGSNNNPQNQHFVLSCAPIQGFNELIKQETNLFRDAMSFSKTLNNNPANPNNAGGSPTSTLNHHNNSSLANHNMSLLEQANRFAEMQSLFQLPNSSSLNNHNLLQFNPNNPHNNNMNNNNNPNPPTDTDYYSLSQFLNNSAHFQEENQKSIQQSLFEKQQRMDKEQKQHKKLKNSIDTHKDRLEKGRNPVRRFPMTGPPPTSSASNRSYGGSRKSPRTMRLQQQRGATAPEPLTGNQEDEEEGEELNNDISSPKSHARHHHNHHSHNQEDRSRSNSPKAIATANRQFPNSAPAGPQQNQFNMNMSISSLGTNHHINNNNNNHSNSPTNQAERQNQTAPAAPKPIQSLTFEEFKTKTDK
jgi:hypothetical protein